MWSLLLVAFVIPLLKTEHCAQVLQALLARGTASLGRGVHTPDELNELLARTPAELERFQQACKKPQAHKPYTLTSVVASAMRTAPAQGSLWHSASDLAVLAR